MADEKDKLEFFSDLKSQLVIVIGGVVSLTTVIPAFLNSITEIFGWNHISSGYYFFVFLYFIVPYLFYLTYCSIHDDVGYLELIPQPMLSQLKARNGFKTLLELLIPLIAFFFLIVPLGVLSYVFSLLLLFTSIAICFAVGRKYYKQKALFKEFFIIAAVIIIIFLLFLLKPSHGLSNYSMEKQHSAFNAYELKGLLKKDFINPLDAARKLAYTYQLQASTMQPQKGVKNPDFCDGCKIQRLLNAINKIGDTKQFNKDVLMSDTTELQKAINNILKYDSTQLRSYNGKRYQVAEIYSALATLDDYGAIIQQKKSVDIDKEWAGLLKDLQFKSMVWFLFLILLGLCLWFKMQFELKLIKNEAFSRTSLLKDNIGQVKSLVLLLFVLMVPWFKQIDSSNVNLEKPFLNVTLSGLINGEYKTDPCCKQCEPNRPDTSLSKLILIDSIKTKTTSGSPAPSDTHKYNDSMLNVINGNVLKAHSLILEHAKRTIGDPGDRNIQ